MAEANTAALGSRKRGRPHTMKDKQQSPEEVGELMRTQQAYIGSLYTETSRADSRGAADVSPSQGDHDHQFTSPRTRAGIGH